MNNDIVSLLMEAKKEGIVTVIENDQLVFKVQKGTNLSPDLVQRLKQKKPDIFSFLSAEMQNISSLNSEANVITKADRSKIERIPLSYSQESAWLEDKYLGGRINLNSKVINFKGKLDMAALQYALTEVVRRHEAFRTLIKETNGIPYQEIISHEKWGVETFDGAAGGFHLEAHLDRLRKMDFDLSKDFSLKAQIIQFSEEDHKLILIFHHIATDDASEAIFIREIVELYRSRVENRPSILKDLELTYSDYAIWQRKFFEGKDFIRKLDYWKEKLDGVQNLNIPFDFQKPDRLTNDGDSVSLEFERELSQRVNMFVAENQITHYIFFLSVFKVLLYRWTGQTDICVGSPVANRNHKDLENIIGYFVNSIPIRTIMDGEEPFWTLLRSVKQSVVKAFEYQEIPFEKIVSAVKIDRQANRHPIYQVVFNALDNTNATEIRMDGFTYEREFSLSFGKSEFDFSLTTLKNAHTVALALNFKTQIISKATAHQLLKYFSVLTRDILDNPGKQIRSINLMDKEDFARVAIDYNRSEYPMPGEYATFLDLFDEQVKRNPDRTAAVFYGQSLSYKDLSDQSNAVANHLIGLGYGRGSLIPLYIDKSIGMLTGLLGIMRSGAAYVSIPGDFPAERIQYVLEQLGAKVVVTNETCNKGMISAIEKINFLEVDTLLRQPGLNTGSPGVTMYASDLAYIIYTSGSTGNPKAVMIEHGSLLNFLYPLIKDLDANEGSTFLNLASYAFDGAYIELYLPLMSGGKVVIAPDEARKDGFLLKRLIESNGLTHFLATPSGYKLLVSFGWNNAADLKLMVSGEALREELVNQVLVNDDQVMLNLYGPTEVTLCGTSKFVRRKEMVTAGKPLPNYSVYVVDEDGRLCPPGITGEILIGGIGVGRGYFKDPKQTEEKFIKNPYDANSPFLLYRTGDTGRWLYNNELEVIGRKDNQVKIRGFRIELDEIEQTLHRIKGVNAVKVVVSDGYHEDARQIIAFIISEDGCDKDSIIGRLKQYLPAYMIPADIIPVKSFPLSRNNKIDTGALLKTLPIYKEAPQQADSLTATEEIVQRLWQRLFNTEKIGVNDDFFRVGGNSILAVRLMANIKTQLGIAFPIDSIFQFSTIRSMSARLDEMRTQTPGKEEELLMKINDSGDRTPLFLAPSVGGNSIEYKKLFEGMSRDQPFFGFLSKGLEGTSAPFETIEEAAEAYVRKIMSLYSTGPVNIGGYSFGGTLAFEMVRLLENAGYTVNTLFILDAFSPGVESGEDSALYDLPFHDWIMFFYKLYFKGHDIDHIRSPLKEEHLSGLTPDEQLQLLYRTVTANGGEYTFQQLKGFTEVYRKNSAMSYNAGSTKIKAKTILFRCDLKHEALVSFGNKERGEVIEREKRSQVDYGWGRLTSGDVTVYPFACTHVELLSAPNVSQVSELMKKHL